MSTVESIARPRRNGERRRAPTASISKESPAITGVDRKSGSAGMPRPISYAVFCLKKKSNDLLQPLNAARLMLSALQDSPLPDKAGRMVEQVHRAREGSECMLADLLALSRLD